MTGTDGVAVVRISGSGRPVGMGVLVGPRQVITCAHVVNAALGRDHRSQPRPDQTVTVQVEFPRVGGRPIRTARVVAWNPPPEWGTGGDVACLELNEDAPADAPPARFAETPTGPDDRLVVFGDPEAVSRPNGVWVEVGLVGAVEGGLIQVESLERQSIRAQPGYSGSPVWRADGRVIGLLHATAPPDEPHRDAYLLPPELLAATCPDQLDYLLIPANPYRGLESFTEAHADVFFGREDVVTALAQQVRHQPVTMLVGPSGVGKSSLVQAGLVPRLLAEHAWSVAVIRPGRDPWHRLAIGLLRALDDRQPQAAQIEATVARLRADGLDWMARLLSSQDRPLLLVVDQFEELLLGDAPPEQELLDLLLPPGEDLHERPPGEGPHERPPGKDRDPGFRTVHTLRADFVPALLGIPGVGPRLVERLFPLSKMTPAEMHAAVLRPAEARGVTFQPGLVDKIVEDAARGSLPLLEFMLTRLWQTQRKRLIDYTGYRHLGEIGEVLDQFADSQIAKVADTPRALLDQVLLSLVQLVGDDVDRAIRRRVHLAGLPPTHERVLQHLARERLVVFDNEPQSGRFAEFAHEALIRSWTYLRDLVRGNAEFLIWLDITQRRIREDDPLPESRIAEATAWIEQRPEEIPFDVHDFVARSRAAAEARNRETEDARQRAEAATDQAEALRLAADCELVARLPRVPTHVALALAVESVLTKPTLQGNLALQHVLRQHPRTLRQIDSGVPPTAVAFDREGTRMAMCGSGGETLVYDTDTGEVVAALTHPAAVVAAAFDADGDRLATSGQDQVVRVYNLADAEPEPLEIPQLGEVTWIEFDPGGALLATADRNGTARVHDASTGAQVTEFGHEGPVSRVTFAPYGQRLAIASHDGTARVVDARTGRRLLAVRHTREVLDVAFAEDGARLVTASGATAQVFDLLTGAPVAQCQLERPVTSVVFSPDGTLVAAAGLDWTARIFRAGGNGSLVVLPHDGAVLAVAFSPDSTQVATASFRSVRVFDAATGTERARLDHDSEVFAVAFTAGGHRVVAAANNGSALVVDVTSGAERTRFRHSGEVRAVAFDPGGAWLATASNDMTARVFDVGTGRERARMHHHAEVLALAYGPDGRRVVTGDREGFARSFDARTGAELILGRHGAEVPAVAFAEAGEGDSDRVATIGKDGFARIYDARTGVELLELPHDGPVTAVAFDGARDRVVTGGHNGVTRVFDATTGLETVEFVQDRAVVAVAVSPGGAYVATASYDATARIFEVATGRELVRLPHHDDVVAVAFSPDGRLLATGSFDKSARVFDVETGIERGRIDHFEAVVAVAFSPDGARVATASHDKTARLIDAASGAELARFDHPDWVTAVAFSPDGTLVATACRDGSARTFEADQALLLERAVRHMVRPMRNGELRQYGLRPNCRHVEHWARHRAEAGDVEEMRRLLTIVLSRRDEVSLAEAEALLERLETRPEIDLRLERGGWAVRRHAFDEAIAIWRRAAHAGNVQAVARLAPIAAADGNLEEAKRLLLRAVEDLDQATTYLAVVSRKLTQRQRNHLRALGGPADTDAINFLGLAEYLDGHPVEAGKLWASSAELGNWSAPILLSRL
ncbi:trypsin-like peptidase domain-containing protein [Dactylosporangium sp. CA-152071]|uniref:nSTAND1 domain-containing NTPase n=1 Tax=Dactylosporangium sp. CA-152071 TaxID=3239933 RepID=UPI003D8DB976